jgi:hypothetical protein
MKLAEACSKLVGEPVTESESFLMVPFGALSRSLVDGYLEGFAAVMPLVGALGMTLAEGAADKALDKSARSVKTIRTGLSGMKNNQLYTATTPTRLVIARARQTLWGYTPVQVLASWPLQTIREIHIGRGLGIFRQLRIIFQDGSILTFKLHVMWLKRVKRMRAAFAARASQA